jgi:hypothetical protein
MIRMDGPQDAVIYRQQHVIRAPQFNPDCECAVVLMMNIKRSIRGH